MLYAEIVMPLPRIELHWSGNSGTPITGGPPVNG
jgi:hypothetical protein